MQCAQNNAMAKENVIFTMYNIGCPTRYRTRCFFNRCSVSQQLGALQTHTTDTFLFISHKTNELLFKFRIIKEMPGLLASGTHSINDVSRTLSLAVKAIRLCGEVYFASAFRHRQDSSSSYSFSMQMHAKPPIVHEYLAYQ